MGFRFMRQRGALRELFDAGARGIETTLADEASAPGEEPRLEPLVETVFERAPTTDVETLRAGGVSAERFYAEELSPNWDGLSRGERAAKIASFMRLANVIGADDAAGMGPVVRTKVLVLAWAYDRVYGESLLRDIQRKPRSFGSLELSAAK